MTVALPVKTVIDHHAFRRTDDTVVRGQEATRQSSSVGVDQPSGTVKTLAILGLVRPVRLKVIQLARLAARHKNAPHVSPAVRIGIVMHNILRLAVVHIVVQQNPHGGCRAAEDDKLHTPIVQDGPVRQRMGELQGRMGLGDQGHKHGMVLCGR